MGWLSVFLRKSADKFKRLKDFEGTETIEVILGLIARRAS
jgi:hypothetical protein